MLAQQYTVTYLLCWRVLRLGVVVPSRKSCLYRITHGRFGVLMDMEQEGEHTAAATYMHKIDTCRSHANTKCKWFWITFVNCISPTWSKRFVLTIDLPSSDEKIKNTTSCTEAKAVPSINQQSSTCGTGNFHYYPGRYSGSWMAHSSPTTWCVRHDFWLNSIIEDLIQSASDSQLKSRSIIVLPHNIYIYQERIRTGD